jgi:hypothetical protein
MSQADRDKALAAAYNAASQHLREEHRDEFNGYYSEEAKERGVVWEPRLNAEQRAEKELSELLARFPHLADRFRDTEPDDPNESDSLTAHPASVAPTG